MTLDRRITIHIFSPDTSVPGQWYPTPGMEISKFEVWASVADGGESDFLDDRGIVTVKRAVVTVRWDQRLIDTPPSLLRFTALGTYYRVDTVQDFRARRRLITMTGTETRP